MSTWDNVSKARIAVREAVDKDTIWVKHDKYGWFLEPKDWVLKFNGDRVI